MGVVAGSSKELELRTTHVRIFSRNGGPASGDSLPTCSGTGVRGLM